MSKIGRYSGLEWRFVVDDIDARLAALEAKPAKEAEPPMSVAEMEELDQWFKEELVPIIKSPSFMDNWQKYKAQHEPEPRDVISCDMCHIVICDAAVRPMRGTQFDNGAYHYLCDTCYQQVKQWIESEAKPAPAPAPVTEDELCECESACKQQDTDSLEQRVRDLECEVESLFAFQRREHHPATRPVVKETRQERVDRICGDCGNRGCAGYVGPDDDLCRACDLLKETPSQLSEWPLHVIVVEIIAIGMGVSNYSHDVLEAELERRIFQARQEGYDERRCSEVSKPAPVAEAEDADETLGEMADRLQRDFAEKIGNAVREALGDLYQPQPAPAPPHGQDDCVFCYQARRADYTGWFVFNGKWICGECHKHYGDTFFKPALVASETTTRFLVFCESDEALHAATPAQVRAEAVRLGLLDTERQKVAEAFLHAALKTVVDGELSYAAQANRLSRIAQNGCVDYTYQEDMYRMAQVLLNAVLESASKAGAE